MNEPRRPRSGGERPPHPTRAAVVFVVCVTVAIVVLALVSTAGR